MDFVGHIWCFKKEWLHYMFAIKPFTYDTGEDMHLCFSSKVLGNIDSFIGEQRNLDDSCDITINKLSTDKFSSYKEEKLSVKKLQENPNGIDLGAFEPLLPKRIFTSRAIFKKIF